MPIIVPTTNDPLTYVAATSQAMVECGLPRLDTLQDPSKLAQRAMQFVNDIVEDVYSRAQWWFRLRMASFRLVAEQMWYQLPDEFGESAIQNIGYRDALNPIEYIAYQDLLALHPEASVMVQQDANWAVDFEPGLAEALALATEKGDLAGDPVYWTIFGEFMGLYPMPSSAWMSSSAVTSLVIPHYRDAPVLYEDGDYVAVPKNLYDLVKLGTVARFKKFLEFPDWRDDQQLYETKITRLIARQRRRTKGEVVITPELT